MKVAEEIVDVERRYLAYLKVVVDLYLGGIDAFQMENKQSIKLILTQVRLSNVRFFGGGGKEMRKRTRCNLSCLSHSLRRSIITTKNSLGS